MKQTPVPTPAVPVATINNTLQSEAVLKRGQASTKVITLVVDQPLALTVDNNEDKHCFLRGYN